MNKRTLLALVLSFALIFSAFGGISVAAEDEAPEITYWDGTTITAPVDSNGDGVYEINNAAELAYIVTHEVNKKYILTADIYVNDLLVNGDTLTKLDGSEVDTAALAVWPAGGVPFCGTLDGNGYTISGLFNDSTPAAASSSDGRGLFNRGYNATVKNLCLSNAYFANGTYMGGVFGYANSGTMITVDNCYVENVTVKTSLASNGQCYPAVGGLVGYTQNSGLTVNNTAVVNAAITGSRDGSILGDAWAAGANNVANTYVISDREPYGNGTSSTGNFKGAVTVSNFYSKTATTGTVAPQSKQVNESGYRGEMARFWVYGLGENFYTTEGYPMQEIFLGEPDPAVNKQLGTAPFEGKGTEEEPYIITDANGLEIAVGIYGGGYHYELGNDIYLNDIDKIDWKTGEVAEGYTANEWFVAKSNVQGYFYDGFANNGRFSGTVDGKGYSVHGLYYNKESLSTATGLFPCTNNATVKNLAIENSYIIGARLNGGITGYAHGGCVVDSCLIKDTVTVVGYNGGNAYFTAANEGKDKDTGLPTGKAVSPFTGTIATGVSFESCATGGIMGYANGTETVSNCAVYAEIRNIADNEKFNTINPLTNGGNPYTVTNGSHINALIGTGWNSKITMTGNLSVLHPHDSLSGGKDKDGNPLYTTNCENNYAFSQYTYNNVTQTCCNVITEDDLGGIAPKFVLDTFDFENLWTATYGYPVQKVFAGEEAYKLGDVNADKAVDASDMAELRKKLIGADHNIAPYAGFVNDNEQVTDILDLVAVKNLIDAE